MRLRSGLWWVAVALVCLGWPASGLAKSVEIGGGARVVRAAGKGKALRVIVDRGRGDGMKVGMTGEIYPVRTLPGESSPTVDFGVRLARGRVVKVGKRRSTLAVDGVAGLIRSGSWFSYDMKVPAARASSALLRVYAVGAGFRPQRSRDLFASFGELLADPDKSVENRVIDAMIADIKGIRVVIVKTMGARVDGGRFHGTGWGELVDGLDRAALRDFLTYVYLFPGRYIGNRFTVAQSWVAWVSSGAPSGDRELEVRKAQPLVTSANRAARRGRLDQARATWKRILARVPDYKQAKDKIALIDRIQINARRIGDDPDDTKTRYTLMDQLADLGAYSLAMKHNQALRRRKYNPRGVAFHRGRILAEQKKWAPAVKIFSRQSRKYPDDDGLKIWLAFARSKLQLARRPDDPAAALALARAQLRWKNFNNAATAYRQVIDSPKASRKQIAEAMRGQRRTSLEKSLKVRLEWARENIIDHDQDRALKQITAITRLLRSMHRPGQRWRGGEILAELAELARSRDNRELALKLFRKRLEIDAKQVEAYSSLAFALQTFDRLDEAEAVIKEGLAVDKDDAYLYLILGNIGLARGDYAEAERRAKQALAKSAKYPWPMSVLARTAAVKDQWDQATERAREALELKDAWEIRMVFTAVDRGRRAYEALQANAGSPRERLRLIRALGDLGLVERARAEIERLPKTGDWRREGWWAIAVGRDPHIPVTTRLAAGRAAKVVARSRKRELAILEARDRLRRSPDHAATRMSLAKLYVETTKYNMALATLSSVKGASTAAAAGDIRRDARLGLEADRLVDQAIEALQRSDSKTCERLSARAAALFAQIGAPEDQVNAHNIRSDALANLGKVRAAIKLSRASRALMVAEGRPIDVAQLDVRIGSYRASIGTLDAKHKAAQAAERICEERDSEGCLYDTYVQLSGIELDRGRTAQSISYARRAWNYADRLGRKDYQRNARFIMADSLQVANKYDDAEVIARPLLADSRAAGDVVNEQYALMVLGVVELNRGNGKASRGYFRRVYNLGTRTGVASWRELALRFEGKAYLHTDHQPAKAAAVLLQATKILRGMQESWARRLLVDATRELADAYLQANKITRARVTATEALALAKKFNRDTDLAATQSILALIAARQGSANAVKLGRAAVAAARTGDNVRVIALALYALAKAHQSAGDKRRALATFERAIAEVNKLLESSSESQRRGFMGTGRVRAIYRDAIALLLEMKKVKRAMQLLEVSRDAELVQSVDPSQVKSADPEVKKQLERLRRRRTEIAGLEKQLDEENAKPVAQQSRARKRALSRQIARTRGELKQVVVKLKASDKKLFEALTVKPQNLLRRSSHLPKGAVLVQYFVARDRLYAFVMSADMKEPAVVEIPVTPAKLQQTIEAFREAIESEPVESWPIGRKLDDWVLEPIRPYLDKAKTLMVMPSGPLHYLPFNALVVSDPGKKVRYAVEDLRIAVQTGETINNVLDRVEPRAGGTMLALADPDGTLPGARAEVKRIVRSAIPDGRVLAREQATRKRFTEMARRYRFLHVAAHGILDPDGGKSHLKLADGPLTVHEIAGMTLEESNELVVLSACESAVAEGEKARRSNADLVSIAWAFAMAGSPSLVASLWKVPDAATAELMATFYRALQSGTGDRLDALRQAQIALLRKTRDGRRPYAAPWNWAGFQIYGDFRRARRK